MCENACYSVTVQVQVGSSLSHTLRFPAGKDKPKSKTAIDLFDEDDDGDIFGNKYNAPTPAQSKKEVVVEQPKPPEKKVKINIRVSHCWLKVEMIV